MEDYRGVTLTQTTYKSLPVSILAKRLREEVERKVILPLNRTGFRRGMDTMDNIYLLNYLINRQVEIGKEGMVIMFVDMTAAFDSVNRRKAVRAMWERGVKEGLRR